MYSRPVDRKLSINTNPSMQSDMRKIFRSTDSETSYFFTSNQPSVRCSPSTSVRKLIVNMLILT